MISALASFEGNIRRARDLVSLKAHLALRTSGALDLDDILRAALVMGVSALDHFIHEVVRLGMTEIYDGKRPVTPSFRRFPISLHRMQVAIGGAASAAWLDEEIRETHRWQTFQQPDKIADAIRLVSGTRLWEEVGTQLGSDARSVKATLAAIVDRRNKIAHEADMDPSFPGQRWPIADGLVQDALDFLENAARAILLKL
jgi:hypothetical protein